MSVVVVPDRQLLDEDRTVPLLGGQNLSPSRLEKPVQDEIPFLQESTGRGSQTIPTRWLRPYQPPLWAGSVILLSYFFVELSLPADCLIRFPTSTDFSTVERYNSNTVLLCYRVILLYW